MSAADAVLWHDLECGGYAEDLPLWRELADDEAGDDPVLDIGAGTGRVALDLAGHGHDVVALDADAVLLGALRDRAAAAGVAVETVAADARRLDLGGRRFGLMIVPMQTVQLLGAEGRLGFLARARAHLRPGGVLALAIADARDGVTDERTEPPLPDLREVGGTLYSSRPVALRDEGFGVVHRAPARGRDALGRAHDDAPTSSASTTSTPPRSRPRRATAGLQPAPAPRRCPRPTSTSARRWWSSVAERTLRVCALYPDLMNIYADRGNLLLLERRCAWRGLGFTATAATLGDRVDPDAHDLFYLGGGQDRDQALCARDLVTTKREALHAAADRGAVVLGVCGGFQLLGHSYVLGDEELPGAGLVDLRTVREDGPRLIGNVAIEVRAPRARPSARPRRLREPRRAHAPRTGRAAARPRPEGPRQHRLVGLRGRAPRPRHRHVPPRPAAARRTRGSPTGSWRPPSAWTPRWRRSTTAWRTRRTPARGGRPGSER